ncbi:MogA/MoaB family molybdenum cofactor biosynthesis protein [Paenibacillus brevis]|uniref:Molybdenum cofactor biosynthesis protein B n=1 Tax=Paenibacillus brevis TaxID=2841508 RepID=A0ABS6FRV7_9BACL|nr:molybdenum cofactor biosynthesis protein B [Paenibacillus brevis]MBU5672984.1 molybdenum cofactor biosynthesis protein MoaB [Paenibacillus brevis]
MRSVDEHRREAPKQVKCLVVTVSDTRVAENDYSGQLTKELLHSQEYEVVDYRIIKDDYDGIRQLLREAVSSRKVEAILLNGGTGIAPRDNTFEAVRSLLNKELPGFGEIFRYLSYTEDIGAAAILSRAIAGTIGNVAIFSMPGSQGAVKLAMEKIILPELRHVIRELNK